jgi:signal transduction histidine kinase/ActR/RegA family two-component response regulator
MKLKTALQIGAIFPIFLAILVALGLVIRSQETQKVIATFGRIDRLVETTGELNRITRRYVLRKDADMPKPWRAKHEYLGTVLSSFDNDRTLEAHTVEAMRESYANAGSIFAELTADDGTMRPSQRIMLEDDLFQQLIDMGDEAFALAKSAHTHAVRAQSEADMVVAPLFGILALAIAGGILITGRMVLRKFALVQEGIAAASTGDFDHWARPSAHDSSDPLSDAFGKMSKKLKSSQTELKDEANRYEQSAEALRKTNMLLSDALVKLKRAQKQAVNTERLKALAQVSSGVTHSFNNSLAPVLALSDYLLAYPDSLNDREALLDNIQTINESARRARDQVFRLSDFFGVVKRGDMEQVDLNEIVKNAVEATEPLWRSQSEAKGISISVKTSLGGLPKILTTPASMKELVTGLILNAVEAMPKGGTITIATREDAGSVVLLVADDGEGMAANVRDRACEPFFSTKSDQSAGMGLAVVSGTVRGLDGILDISSSPGGGTTVSVAIPVKEAVWESPEDKTTSTDAAKNLRILVVDDEESIRSALSRLLSAEGHTVVSAGDGPEGLEKIRAEKFDVLFQDQALPGGMSGDEVARAAKEVCADLRVILLTGFGDEMKEEGALPKGVDLILSKPATLDEIQQSLIDVVSL